MSSATLDIDFITAFQSRTLTKEQARQFAEQPPEIVVFTLLELMGQQRESLAHQPSSTIPPFQKPSSKSNKKGKVGAKSGHAGAARKQPEKIDHHLEHELPCCPHCTGKLTRTGDTRTRITEDMPVDLKFETTEHTIHSDWCPKCKKRVEPKLPEVLPHCTIGNRLLAFTGWMHYGNGLTISQISETLNYHLQIKITDGGLVQMWHRLADLLAPWYEEIRAECLSSSILHADETGWRVHGKTHWLWCFTQKNATFYRIDASRGHPALEKFFVEEFQGVLITDFWAAYDLIGRDGSHQRCWPHLLRELKEVSKTNSSDEWLSFARRTRRIYTDAIKLELKGDVLPEDEYSMSVAKLERRAIELGITDWHDADAKRLAKRLHKYGDELLTFLWYDDVPPDNNAAERAIRPAVVMRKNSYANQSDRGANTQSILMSIFRTLKQRGLNPLAVITSALHTLATTSQLPPLSTTSFGA